MHIISKETKDSLASSARYYIEYLSAENIHCSYKNPSTEAKRLIEFTEKIWSYRNKVHRGLASGKYKKVRNADSIKKYSAQLLNKNSGVVSNQKLLSLPVATVLVFFATVVCSIVVGKIKKPPVILQNITGFLGLLLAILCPLNPYVLYQNAEYIADGTYSTLQDWIDSINYPTKIILDSVDEQDLDFLIKVLEGVIKYQMGESRFLLDIEPKNQKQEDILYHAINLRCTFLHLFQEESVTFGSFCEPRSVDKYSNDFIFVGEPITLDSEHPKIIQAAKESFIYTILSSIEYLKSKKIVLTANNDVEGTSVDVVSCQAVGESQTERM